MKKSTLIPLGVVGLIVVLTGTWVVMQPKPEITPPEPIVSEEIPIRNIPQADVAVPQAAVQNASVGNDSSEAPPSSSASPVSETIDAVPAADTQESEIPQEEVLSENDKAIAEQFKDLLSFPLTEARIESFAKAAIAVEETNNKWDVQIASAESQDMAIEYNNFAVEEIDAMMDKIPGLTLEQYNELVILSSKDPKFYEIYLAYRDMILDDREQAKKEAAEKAQAAKEDEAAAPLENEAEAVKPPSEPVTPDTTPTPQG